MSRRARFQVYPENHARMTQPHQRWRWRFIASNGKIMADGGEAYATASNAVRAIKRFAKIAVPQWGRLANGGGMIETLRG